MTVYVRDNASRRLFDIELRNIERIWIEVMLHNKKHLICTFYRPPSSSNAVLSSVEDSVGLAFDTNIDGILVSGGFNRDLSKCTISRKTSGARFTKFRNSKIFVSSILRIPNSKFAFH